MFGSYTVCMSTANLIQSIVSNPLSITDVLVPLQFSGGFLQWAIVFIILAIVAAAVGASGVAGISMTVAKWFIILFVVLAVVSLVL